MSQQASFGRFGQLALTYCGKFLPLEVLHSAAGHCVGAAFATGAICAATSAHVPFPMVLSRARSYRTVSMTWAMSCARSDTRSSIYLWMGAAGRMGRARALKGRRCTLLNVSG